MEAINKFRQNKEVFISFDELSNIPLNEKKEINEAKPGSIITYRINNLGDDLSFRVEMKKGESWVLHSHDCQETILIYEGSLIDIESKKIANRLEFLIFPINVKHEVLALEDSIFYVEFKNPHKE